MPAGRTKRPKCNGSVYLHVLASSVLVTIIGLGALATVRIQTRSALRARDVAEARSCAVSAVELGLLFVTQDPNWRTVWSNGAWLSDKPLGDATFTLQGVDPHDNDLTDSNYEPVVLTGIGTKGIARHKTQVTLVPVVRPLEALNTCVHAGGNLQVKGGDRIIAVGAPVSTNGILDNDEIIDGDAEAGSIDSMVTITGTLTVPAPAKALPDPGVFSDYASRATAIPGITTIDKMVLTPTSNPWGASDPNGLYFIDTGGNDITIKDSRIHGTLVIRAGDNKKIIIDNAVFMQSYRSDYPVLIVDGNLEIRNNSCDYPLSETSCGTNFNPIGAPYDGDSDDDILDEYPNEIRGLIHTTGTLTLFDTARIEGAVICEGPATMDGANTIIHDPGLYTSPPEGYTYVERMAVSPGSWKQVVD
ncbi:MAG: hypothetical protein JW741_07875 [Sedimentisphaerales bacterium]|nr:hypothetical protein [Sedimentisphaerales bacterium]